MIQAYRDKKFSDAKGLPTFTVPINPEQLQHKLQVKNDKTTAAGNQGSATKYSFTLPEELKLDFVLDNTNTIHGNAYQGIGVPDQIDNLLKTVYNVHGPTHQPNYLKIGWNKKEVFGSNKTTFECRLKSLDINYVLFNSEGIPLRAKVSASFVAFIEDEKRVKEQDNQSPDLTHIRNALPGDALWRMTNEIYGSPDYVTQIARFNDLDSFRAIAPGADYQFPPFDKNELVA
ncbi:MAG: hypothetical protein AAF564_16050 [Bacteroidota bacterium]